jgi:DNA invertase Pin-like site-specific DNA recombinase
VEVEFFDQESGAKDDRPGWTSLTQEARDAATRRFDAVVIYQTSRLSRDRVSAGLFHRESGSTASRSTMRSAPATRPPPKAG